MSYTTAINNFVNSTGMSAGWKECEKENYFYPLNHSTSQGTMPLNFMAQQQPSLSLSSSYPPPQQQQQRSVSPLPGSVPVIEEVELEELVTFLRKFDSKVAAIWGSNDNEQEEAKKKIMNDNNLMMLMMMNGSQSHIADSSNGGKGVIGERVWGQPLSSSTEVSLNGISKSRLFDYQDNNNNKNAEKQLKMDDNDEDMIVEDDLLTSETTHFRPIQQEIEEDDSSLGFWSLEDPSEYATEFATYKRTADSTFPLRFKIRNENDKAVQTDSNYNYSASTSSFASTTSPWNAPISTSSMGFTSDEEDGVAAATDKLYLW